MPGAVPGARVAVVVLENKAPRDVLAPGAGWLAGAARRGGRAVNAYGEVHPSLGNYIAMISGSTHGVADDNVTDGPFNALTLASQLNAHGVPWKAYFDAMPQPCFGRISATDQTGLYARRHNPFLFFAAMLRNAAGCRRHVVPGGQLRQDLAAGTLPRFVWITPNLCQDMHDCPVAAGQRWMSQTLPPLIRALGPRGVLFVTADEGVDDGGVGGPGGGRIPMVALGGDVRPGSVMRNPVNHLAMLATVEDVLGLGRLSTTRASQTLRPLLRP